MLSGLMLHQGDNFRFGQRDYFRFLKVKSSFLRKEDQPSAKGTDHVDTPRT
jgi:hypothetical protein